MRLPDGSLPADPRLGRLPEFDDRLIAWLAGLFEGEGTIALAPNRRTRAAVSLRLGMTDEDVVRRCREITEVGSITVRERGYPRKPLWTWGVYNREDVTLVLVAIRPFLGKRRGAKTDEALAILSLGDLRRRPEEHGTIRGYWRHLDRSEQACSACREANRLYSIEGRRRVREAA